MAEKNIVYDEFPIPLINRLEKHILTMQTVLSPDEEQMAQQLIAWAEQFLPNKRQRMLNRLANSTFKNVS